MAQFSDLIYEFSSYKEYLKEIEAQKLIVSKGFRAQLAKAASCNTPFISHVLNGTAHFSFEQAFGICLLFGFNESETQFFMLLVQLERAGTQALKAHWQRQIDAIKEKRQVLHSRLKGKNKLNLEDKVRYYSSWEYAAIHVLITIQHFQTLQSISKRLSLSEPRVVQILTQLIEMGLVEKVNDNYCATTEQIYLGNDSDLISKHHTNWRVKSLSAISQPSIEGNLHYSSAITISEADAKKLRKMLVNFIAEVNPIINSSKEEEVYSLCFDFFKL